MYRIGDLKELSASELASIAEKLSVPNHKELEKKDLIYKILDQQALTLSQERTSPSPPKKEDCEQAGKSYQPSKQSGERKPAPQRDPHQNGQQYRKNDQQKPYSNEKRQTNNSGFNLQSFAGQIEGEGAFDFMPDGYGFLRSSDYNYLSSPDDIYVSHNMVRQWGLKKGDFVEGKLRPPKPGEKYFGLVEINSVNGRTLQELRTRSDFQHLTPLFPEKKLQLSYKPSQYALRMIELFAPIGKGQRAMIVSPPKAGKTMLLKEIANGISHNHPEVYLIILMIGERPEEVTDMRRSVKAEVLASTFDEPYENHVKIANITIQKAKRMVECGHDVVLMLDSITRLARAYNNAMPSSGKLLSGGVDAQALHIPKRLFGAARNIENGGSLTNIATALIDTGSKMDEVIFEEFKGTGNTELQLSRTLANKSLYPAIDIVRSGTRRGEDMHPPEQLKFINMLKRVMSDMHNIEEPLKFLLDNMKGTKSNEEFLASIRY